MHRKHFQNILGAPTKFEGRFLHVAFVQINLNLIPQLRLAAHARATFYSPGSEFDHSVRLNYAFVFQLRRPCFVMSSDDKLTITEMFVEQTA